MNNEGLVACHYFERFRSNQGPVENIYLLMRETIEPGESIETCLARGLKEEFGAIGMPRQFLGTIVSHFPNKQDILVEKTTLYFLVDCLQINQEDRDTEGEESKSKVCWLTIDELKQRMVDQSRRYPERTDFNESIVLDRARAIIQ